MPVLYVRHWTEPRCNRYGKTYYVENVAAFTEEPHRHIPTSHMMSWDGDTDPGQDDTPNPLDAGHEEYCQFTDMAAARAYAGVLATKYLAFLVRDFLMGDLLREFTERVEGLRAAFGVAAAVLAFFERD